MSPMGATRMPALMLVVLLSALGYAVAVPIWDSDFWWHIASGRTIWHDGALPEVDPFGVFGNENPIRNETILKGQWLGQILLYGIYELGGAHAIVALRVTLLLLSLLLVHSRLRQFNIPLAGRLAAVALIGLCLQGYTGDRPQLFSIFFAALTFWVVDRAGQDQAPRLYFLLPLIALVWANMHGGVVLGSALLIVHALMHWWRSRSNQAGAGNATKLLLAAALFAAATLLTPNGLDAYAYIFDLQGSNLQARTSEYTSALKIYQLGHNGLQVWVGFALLFAFLGMLGQLRAMPGQALLIALLLALSIESFRYLVFLLVVTAPYVVQGLSHLVRRLPRPAANMGRGLVVSGGIVLASIAFVVLSQGSAPRSGINSHRYPVQLGATDMPLQGRAFNFMNWGGYLLWHDPKLTPYIDGRMLDDKRLVPYTHMLWASGQGQIWFEQADFDWVLIPHRNQQGEIYGLNAYLEHHPQWSVHRRDGNGTLYRNLNNVQAANPVSAGSVGARK